MAKSVGGIRDAVREPNLNYGSMALASIGQRKIAAIIASLRPDRQESKAPFAVCYVENRMVKFSETNNITLAGKELCFSPFQIQHAQRTSKKRDGVAVPASELINFPLKYKTMDLYGSIRESGA